MAQDYASAVQAVALRVCKLDITGAPVVGAKKAYVTSKFARVSFTPEYEEGEEVKEKAADGSVCVYHKMDDTLLKANLEVAICDPQPELYEMLGGGDILEGGGTSKTVNNKALTSNVATLTTAAPHGLQVGDTVTVSISDPVFDGTFVLTAVTSTTLSYAKTNANVTSGAATGTVVGPILPIGWASPEVGQAANPLGLGLEVWSKAIVGGRLASVNPYWRWVFPFSVMRMDGERVLENGAMAHAFSGYSLGNTSFGDGPGGDWDFPSGSPIQYARDATAPTGVNDYITVS